MASAAGPIDEQKIEKIMKTVAPSVVKVEARNGVRKVATGVVIDKDGTIVTTALISPRDEEITVLTSDGKQHKADFKGFDTSTGLAVIQVKDKRPGPDRPRDVGRRAAGRLDRRRSGFRPRTRRP